MIIFDESEYCNSLLGGKVERILQKDLNYLASRWLEEYSEKDVTEKLKVWCLEQDPEYNLIINRKKIKNALSHGKKYALRKLVGITVSEKELEAIQRVEDYKIQKILFVILVTAKFFKYNNSRKILRTKPENIGVYYNKPIQDAFKLAGVSISRKDWHETSKTLHKLNLLSPTTNGKYRVSFTDDESKVVIAIQDYRNIIAYFQEYSGERVIECEGCGMKIVKSGRNHKFCKKCWNKKNLSIQKEWEKKKRKKNVEVFEIGTCD